MGSIWAGLAGSHRHVAEQMSGAAQAGIMALPSVPALCGLAVLAALQGGSLWQLCQGGELGAGAYLD
jgi:hypothetical protein